MAFTGIMTTEAEIDQKSGAGVSASYTDTMKTAKLLQVESFINVLTRTNFSDSFATLNVDVKGILSEASSSLVAIEAIKYDMSGYTTRIEAEDMINLLWARFNQCIGLLIQEGSIDFIKEA